jgi:hypothetical protein
MISNNLFMRREFADAAIGHSMTYLSQPDVLPEIRPGYSSEVIDYLAHVVAADLVPTTREGVQGLEAVPSSSFTDNSFAVVAAIPGETIFFHPELLQQTTGQMANTIAYLANGYDYTEDELVNGLVLLKRATKVLLANRPTTIDADTVALVNKFALPTMLYPPSFPRLQGADAHSLQARPTMTIKFRPNSDPLALHPAVIAHESDHAVDGLNKPYELVERSTLERVKRELKAYHVSAHVGRSLLRQGRRSSDDDELLLKLSSKIDELRQEYADADDLLPGDEAVATLIGHFQGTPMGKALGIV